MDNAEHIAALKITRHWLNNTPKWNFGKFNQDLDQHIYPLLKIRYPLPDEWPLSKKKHIAEYVKERKKDLWRKSLTEIINNNDCDSSECKKALRALASSTDADVEANDIPVEDCLYDQPPPRKRKERDEESPPTREPPPSLGWHRNDTHSPPLYTSSTRSQEDGGNTSGWPPRNISGSNGGKGVKDGTDVRHRGTGVKVEREDVEEEEEEQEEEEEEQGEEAGPGVRGSRSRSASSSLASSSPSLPPGFFQEFDDILSECEGCCRHANSIGADGESCLDCCSHPPTEVCSSTPSPPSHPPVPSSSQRKAPNLFTDYRSHHITPSRLASFPPPSNLLRHDTPTPKPLVQRCSLAPQLEQLQSQLASNTKRIASHDKILVHHSKQIKENRQDILNHRGVLATMQRVMFLQREVDKTMSELKLQYLGDPDDLAGLSSTSSTNGNESK